MLRTLRPTHFWRSANAKVSIKPQLSLQANAVDCKLTFNPLITVFFCYWAATTAGGKIPVSCLCTTARIRPPVCRQHSLLCGLILIQLFSWLFISTASEAGEGWRQRGVVVDDVDEDVTSFVALCHPRGSYRRPGPRLSVAPVFQHVSCTGIKPRSHLRVQSRVQYMYDQRQIWIWWGPITL